MTLRNLDLRLLRVFNALMVEGTVTKAAERLHITQSATSQALGQLRAAMSDPLFVRTGQVMRPTPKALAIAEPVRQAMRTVSAVLDTAVIFDPTKSERTFEIAITDLAQVMLLPPLARRIGAEASGIRLLVTSLSPDQGFQQMRDGRLDLFITRFVITKIPWSFRTRTLFTDKYAVLARTDHPTLRSKITLADYAAAEHIVVAPRGSWQPGPTDQALAKHGLKRTIRMMVPHYMVVPYIVAQSDFIATVPVRAARQAEAQLSIQRFPLPIDVASFKVEMAWDEQRQNDPSHQWLRSLIVDVSRAI